MKQATITYAELARRVGDTVLFNNHNVHNDYWYCDLLETPLVRESLDAMDIENGIDPDDQDAERASVTSPQIYQTYHITWEGARYLINHTAELVSYDEDLDAWLWHITHWGTAWTHVYATVYDFSDEPDHEYINAIDYKHYRLG